MNKHLTYEEWFNQYNGYEDCYKHYVKCVNELDRLSLLAYERQQKIDLLDKTRKRLIRYIKNNCIYAELEDYGKNGDYYIKINDILEVLDSNKKT